MDGATQCFFSTNATALAAASFIFFITLFFVSKQWIGFSITMLLLFFSLITGLIIVNHDVFRDAIRGTPTNHFKDLDFKMTNFNEQVLKMYDSLKAEMEIQKHKLQALSDEVQELKKKQGESKP